MVIGLGISLILVSIIFMIWFLSYILYNLNRKKGFFSYVLSLLFTSFSIYYIFMSFYTNRLLKTFGRYEKAEKINVEPKIEKSIEEHKEENTKEPEKISLIFQINGNNVKVGIDEEIEIKKDTTFIISDIEGINKKNLKVNLVGFVGDYKYNKGHDIGYKISYKDMWKNKEVDKDKFEIEIKKDKKKIGSVYLKFVD